MHGNVDNDWVLSRRRKQERVEYRSCGNLLFLFGRGGLSSEEETLNPKRSITCRNLWNNGDP